VTARRIFCLVALSPAVLLVWLFYVLPAWALGAFEQIGWIRTDFGWAVLFRISSGRGWLYSKWRDWRGWSGPAVEVIRWEGQTSATFSRTLRHEIVHLDQQFRWGLAFYPAYLLASLWIWLFQRKKHAYLDNPFERVARAWAGQPVDIPREDWPQGPGDRWPWW
jgi:hypothetical protein